MENKQRTKCERYSRVVGYIRPISEWNDGKVAEFKDRKTFKLSK
jgi:ribonucleoside-triphosphate reductase